MTKIQSVNPTQAIFQLAAQTTPYQWLRELVVNGLEAGATNIEIEPHDDTLYTAYNAYKIMVSDNGCGMGPDELKTLMRSIFQSGKSMGSTTENMGIGGRITTLDWNTYGVVYLSVKDGDASMAWLWLNPQTNEFEIRDFWDDNEEAEVAVREPDVYTIDGVTVDWAKVIPSYIVEAGHGTAVVLLGDAKDQHTRLGNPRVAGEGWQLVSGEKKYANMPEWNYLMKRFWSVGPLKGDGYEWTPAHPDWAATKIVARGIKESSNTHDQHFVWGAMKNIFEPQGVNKKNHPAVEYGEVDLSSASLPAKVRWFLREERLTSLFSYWKVPAQGYTVALYRDELYDFSRQRFRSFGVGYKDVYDRLFIVIEPLAAEGSLSTVKGSLGVRPNNVRSKLLWGDNTNELPWDEWARMFRDVMPTPISDAIDEYEKTLPSFEQLDPETLARVANYLDTTFPLERVRRRSDSGESYAEREGGGAGTGSSGSNQKKPPLNAETGHGKGGSAKGGGSQSSGSASGGLSTQSGNTPGQRFKSRGTLPEPVFCKVADLATDDEESAFYGIAFTPGKKGQRDTIQIAEDFRDVTAIRERLAQDFAHNPAVTEKVLIETLRRVLGVSVLVRVATILRHKSEYSPDVRERMLHPLTLTQGLIGLESEYREVRSFLGSQYGLSEKGKAA